MRPRFSLKTLLVLPLLFALGWAWVTWPQRTFDAFVNAIKRGDYDAANAMVVADGCTLQVDAKYMLIESDAMSCHYNTAYFAEHPSNLMREDQTALEQLCGHARYTLLGLADDPDQFTYEVQWGTITLRRHRK